MLAGELFLLLEGARVAAQSMGPQGLGDRLVRMGEARTRSLSLLTNRPDDGTVSPENH